MSSSYGEKLKISVFGQSHSEAIGVVIDGLRAGIRIDFDYMRRIMNRRKPGRNPYSTGRKEEDFPEFVSGLVDGVTCGTPLCALIRNTDTRSSDYELLRDLPRPSHADFAAYAKFGAAHDIRGGGHFSGRLTAALCVAGAIALQLLREKGIVIRSHIASVGTVQDALFDPLTVNAEEPEQLNEDFPVISQKAKEKMLAEIESARLSGDSVGGTVECAVVGMPAGIGDPIFHGLENRIAAAIFGIPAVKGIEFGSGFAGSSRRGSENNDPFTTDGTGIKTKTNNHGGILGGISSGMPILFKVAFKPTPSIAAEQESVSLSSKTPQGLRISGRHDPCIVPRAAVCVEAVCAIAILDSIL